MAAVSVLLDKSEYEVVIPYIDTELHPMYAEFGYNFGICLRAKALISNSTVKAKSLPSGLFMLNKSDSYIKSSDYVKNLNIFRSMTTICGLVTSPCDGTVVYIESSKYKNRYSMTIYIDDSQAIIIDNLCYIFYGIEECSKIFAGDKLGLYYVPTGNAKDIYPYLVFSYATNIPSNAPVRIWDATYYKHNPTDKLEQVIEPNVVKVNNDIPSDQGFEYGVSDGGHSTPEVPN